MKLILLGTEHRRQVSDPSLKEVIRSICRQYHVTLIAEESRPGTNTVAKEVAEELGIAWVPVDMTDDERREAKVFDKLCERPVIDFNAETGCLSVRPVYFRYADGVREQCWLDRAAGHKNCERTLLVCGSLHVQHVSAKAAAPPRSHRVLATVIFPENLTTIVPEVRD